MWERYNLMAQTAMNQGKPQEAETLFRNAVTEAESFDAKDPRLASTLNNLGNCLRNQGKYPDAEQCYKRALEVRQKAIGPLHMDLVPIYENYAKMLRAAGREAEGNKMEQHARAIFAKN
jgi:tetratricopeptide (TPR) repeat protein